MLEVTGRAQNNAGPEQVRQRKPAGRGRQRRRRASRSLPRIVLAEGLLPAIHDYVSRFLRKHGKGTEAGGMLLGEYAPTRGVPGFKVYGLIDAGPAAEFSGDNILFDGEYQFQALQALRRDHPETGNMGCIHLHPDQMDQCSLGDREADVAAVRSSDTRALVFGLITRNNPRPDPVSVFYKDFKLDFFVLGEQTHLRYVHVRPQVEKLPLVQLAPAPVWPRRQPGQPSAGPTPKAASGPAMVRFGRHYAACPKLLLDKRRLVAEVRAMAERYGDRAVLHYRRNLLYWDYTVVESGRRFPVEVRYPRRYPLEPPQLFSRLPLPPSPHQLLGNEICWTNRSVQGEWNPARDTAATCLHAAHRWFACLLVYLTLGAWPEEANDEFPRSF